LLRLPPFSYSKPRSVDEAVALLSRHGDTCTAVAGGTDLYPGMKRGLFTPSHLIGLSNIPAMTEINADPENLTLGCGATLAEIARHPMVRDRYPALASAADGIATPQIRNRATLGGNLCVDTRCTWYNQSASWRQALGHCKKKDGDTCWVAPGAGRCVAMQSSDLAPVLIALGAKVKLVGPDGSRWLPVEGLYRDDGIRYLTKAPVELLVEVQLSLALGTRLVYLKLRRRGAIDFPELSVAAALHLDTDGRCISARIVLGAVASAPLRASEAESHLIGTRIGPDAIDAAASAVYRLAKPLDTADMTVAYRKRMARIFTARALRQALAPSQSV
jgi:4-hydroxybenzoyl-CoA reductase subunit beta